MVKAFFLDTEIVAGKTVREADGLALSSRNLNLTVCERRTAPQFNEVLRSDLADEAAALELGRRGFDVDYIKTIDGRRFGAVSLGAVRLIDNVAVTR
jgi:pantoate--beta-alanine ligase